MDGNLVIHIIQIALIVRLIISNSQRFRILRDALYSASFFSKRCERSDEGLYWIDARYEGGGVICSLLGVGMYDGGSLDTGVICACLEGKL
jgi:hypothetical protein